MNHYMYRSPIAMGCRPLSCASSIIIFSRTMGQSLPNLVCSIRRVRRKCKFHGPLPRRDIFWDIDQTKEGILLVI